VGGLCFFLCCFESHVSRLMPLFFLAFSEVRSSTGLVTAVVTLGRR
jgi:hypothetical protein